MSRFILPAALACCVGTGALAQSDYPALLDKVWSTVDNNFYDPTFNGSDWKAVGIRYRARVASVKTDEDFKALASAMLNEIGTSHLYIVAPSRSAASGVGIGVGYRELDGSVLVSQVTPLSEAGVRVGDRLLSSRESLIGEVGTRAQGRFEDCGGKVRDVSARRIAAFWPPEHPAFQWWSAKVSQIQTIGYIRIDRFDDGAAALADRAMAELKDTAGLVIDVRENSGGNASALRLASYFAAGETPAFALFARPYLQALGHKVTRADVAGAAKITGAYTDEAIFAAVSSNKGAATFWSEDLSDRRYLKPVVVLIGEDTGSAAEGFGWMMRGLPQVKFVGRRTAGALLSADRFPLPGGWVLTVPVQGVWGADGSDYRDRAVAPDVAVPWTRADMCSGRDPDVLAALALLIR